MLIKTWRDPYEAGFSPTTPKEIELNTGLTVLVGCNGAGKSTLLLNIEEHCKNNKIPCYKYDNLVDGGSNAIESLLYNGNYNEGAGLLMCSEGESIKENIGRESTLYKNFFQTGFIDNQKNRFIRIFANSDKLNELKESYQVCRDRVLLFDAVDSGLSVDSIVEVKAMFDAILADSETFDVNIYIVIAANEYELARKASCFDVNAGKYIEFNDYEDYRKFIIKSRANKEKRIEKQKLWREKQRQKHINQLNKLIETIEPKYNKLIEGLSENNSFSYRYKIDDTVEPIKDFLRYHNDIPNDLVEKCNITFNLR